MARDSHMRESIFFALMLEDVASRHCLQDSEGVVCMCSCVGVCVCVFVSVRATSICVRENLHLHFLIFVCVCVCMQQGRHIAHKFESGWEVGVIKAFDKKGLHAGKFSVKYKDDPN